MKTQFFCTLLLAAANCTAATVLNVTKQHNLILSSQPDTNTWKENDSVCVVRKEIEIACGTVKAWNDSGAVIQLNYIDENPEPGDDTQNASEKAKATIQDTKGGDSDIDQSIAVYSLLSGDAPKLPDSSYKPSLSSAESIESSRRKIMLGISSHAINPHLFGQYQVGDRLTLGAEIGFNQFSKRFPVMPGTSLSGTAWTLRIGVNYYSSLNLDGFWAQVGGGVFSGILTQGTISGDVTGMSGIATAGWRWRWSELVIGTALGGEIFKAPDTSSFPFTVEVAYPIALVDVAFIF